MWWPLEAIGGRVALPAHDRPCPVKVLFSSRSTGIAPSPSPTLVGGPRNLSLFYLSVVASSSSPLFSVTLGSMSVLSVLSSLLRSANGRMTSGQLAMSSFVKIDVDSQDRIWLLLIPYRWLLQPWRSVLSEILSNYGVLWRWYGSGPCIRAPVILSVSHLSPQTSQWSESGYSQVIPNHSLPLPAFYCRCMLDVRSRSRDYGWCIAAW